MLIAVRIGCQYRDLTVRIGRQAHGGLQLIRRGPEGGGRVQPDVSPRECFVLHCRSNTCWRRALLWARSERGDRSIPGARQSPGEQPTSGQAQQQVQRSPATHLLILLQGEAARKRDLPDPGPLDVPQDPSESYRGASLLGKRGVEAPPAERSRFQFSAATVPKRESSLVSWLVNPSFCMRVISSLCIASKVTLIRTWAPSTLKSTAI